MGDRFSPQYRHLEHILFVTTDPGFGNLRNTEHGRVATDDLQREFPENLLFIDGDPIIDLSILRDRLQSDDSIEGVVILGDYEHLPSRSVLVMTPEELSGLANCGDSDFWSVWNDDQYGDIDGIDMVAELPVSRLPFVPNVGGILGDQNRNTTLSIPAFGGLRSEEFVFADEVYFRFLDTVTSTNGGPATMPTAPPFDTTDIDSGADIAAERLYLPLHSESKARATYQGAGVDAITLEILDPNPPPPDPWQTRGVTFAGACWGALIGSAAWKLDKPVIARSPADSIAMSMLNHGANAVVGFTALHYVPWDNWSRGGALHCAFWNNVVKRSMSPAKALHQAKLRFMADAPARNRNAELRAIDRKTYWSASCLGLGWQAAPEDRGRKPGWLASVRMR